MAATSAEFIFSTSALPPSGVDCHGRAEPALLAGIGQRAGYRMQDADLHRCRLRARYDRRADQTDGRDSAQSARLQKPAAADARKIWTRHWLSPPDDRPGD